MMLIVSFIAICLACVCLYLELEKYGKHPWWDTTDATPATTTGALVLEADTQIACNIAQPLPDLRRRLT